MRALRLHRPAPVETAPLALEEISEPRPGPGELLVRVSVCAVCRTDLHLVEGDLPDPELPLVPGHMAVGRVEHAGPRATGFALGQRVGIAWLRGTCGRCSYCRAGRENLCSAARFTGFHEDGGYAELATVPAAWAYPIPEGFADEAAAPLLCAGIIGYRALALAGVAPGGRLGLVGFGNSAHVVLQIARHRGCEVYVASRGGLHRELAQELGATWVGDIDALAPESLDGAILFAPAGELVPPLLRSLRRGATLACAGIHMTPIPTIDYDRELFGERVLRSVTANTRADGFGLLGEAAAIPVRPRTTVFPLEQANEALQALKHDRLQGSAVLQVAQPD